MVDSLWDTVEVLRDWKSMSELLLSDELGKCAVCVYVRVCGCKFCVCMCVCSGYYIMCVFLI